MLIIVKVIPNSKRKEIVKIRRDPSNNDILKVKLISSPQQNKANKELIKILANYYKIPSSQIKIVRGEKNRLKLVEIKNN